METRQAVRWTRGKVEYTVSRSTTKNSIRVKLLAVIVLSLAESTPLRPSREKSNTPVSTHCTHTITSMLHIPHPSLPKLIVVVFLASTYSNALKSLIPPH